MLDSQSSQLLQEKLNQLKEQYKNSLNEKQQELLTNWRLIRESSSAEQALKDLYHLLHNLSGTGATFGYRYITEQARILETIIKSISSQDTLLNSERIAQIDVLIDALHKELTDPVETDKETFVTKPAGTETGEDCLIYIVDDDESYALRTSTLLINAGYRVKTFQSPAGFLSQENIEKPDVILMDMMFGADLHKGAEIVTRYRSELYQDIPVIFVSARDDLEARLNAVRAKADYYLLKPFDTDHLLHVLQIFLARRRRTIWKVIIVDDDEIILSYYRMVLKGAGMEVECVSHPLQVVDKIRELHPDIILMDVNMPFCNGIELSAIIRQYPELISIPIVFMTTDTNFEIRCLAEDFGAEEFLVKPVSTQQLITAVSSRAKRYRQLRDLSMELFENRSRHDNIVKTLNDVIWSAEPTAMNLTFISPSCSVVFGRSAESMKKDPDWRNFVFMEDRLFVQSEIDKLHAQENIDFVYRIVRSDYTFRWVSESIIKVTDAEGDITRYDGVIHDITSREMDKQNIKRRLTLESELSVFTKALLQNHDIDLAFECLLRMTSAKVIQVYHHHSIDDSQDTYTNLMRLGNTKYSGSTETIIHADKNAYWIKELKKGNHVFAPGLQPRFDVPYSNLLIPIFVQNVWFGFISFILDDSHPYGSGEELAIIKSATEILSNFFEKEKSSVEKARQDKLLLAAGKISRTLLLEHDFTKSIRSTLDIIRDSTGYDDIFILKFSAHDQQFSQYSECTLTVGKHIQQSYQSFLNQHWKTWSDQLYKKQSVVLSKSQIIDMDFDEDSEPAQNLISTPICPGLELWGVLVLISFRAEHHLQKQHLTVIKSIADSFGGALIRQKSHEDLLTATHLAEQANRSKSEFLANMSHEIRTPMNAIMGFAQLLKRDKGSAESTEYLDLILDSGTRLLSMITDVLDLANVDIGKTYVNKIQVDIQSLLTSIWEQYLPTIVQKGLRPSLEIGDEIPLAQTDPDKITRLVSNLLSNAVKFTDSGFITLKAGYQKTGESSFNLCIEVVDSGIGIPPSKQDIIFNAFEQADSSKTRRYSGIGLGLTLASRIIRILNGSIGFTSKHGVGTHFVVNLPIDFIRTSEKELSEPKQKTAVEQIHILAAEDNRINRLLISKIFEKTPYQLHLVENGQLAVEYLLEHPEIKLVLMDVHMPVLSGTEATVMIKANAKVAHVPVVALTASVLQEDIGICFEAGMDDFLEKPIQTDKLFSVLKKWCG